MAVIGQAPTHALLAVGLFVLWVVAEGAVHLLRLYQPETPTRRRAALGALQTAWALCLTVGWFDAFVFHATTLLPDVACYAGALIALLGIVLRIVARATLGAHFSAYVQTNAGHRLVEHGVYAWLRHPAYTGFVGMLLGLPIAFGSLTALAIAVAVGLPALIVRIRAEEAALLQWFGEDYRAYQQSTARLIPWVW